MKIRWIIWAILLQLISFNAIAANDKNAPPAFVTDFLKEKNIFITKTYRNGFEDIKDFKGHYIVPPDHRKSSSHKLESVNVMQGKSAHKAWMYGTNPTIAGKNTNHRAYPSFQMSKTALGVVKGMALVDIYVWVDIDLFNKPGRNWASLATFTSYYDVNWFRTYLVNIDANYKMHLMHVPEQGVSKPDIYQNKDLKMPRKAWVRVTTLIDYSASNRFNAPFIALWQDGKLVSASRFKDRINPYKIKPSQYPKCLKKWDKTDIKIAENLCGLNYLGGLAQMHFGLYAPPRLRSGVIYNDNLIVRELVRRK